MRFLVCLTHNRIDINGGQDNEWIQTTKKRILKLSNESNIVFERAFCDKCSDSDVLKTWKEFMYEI